MNELQFNMITGTPKMVSKLGCFFNTIQTHTGLIWFQEGKKVFAFRCNLGAIVTKAKGIATHITHIKL